MPLLAVEVRSPSTAGRDAVLKRREYARLGIRCYWMFDVDAPSLRVLELENDDDVEKAYVVGDESVSVSLPFPLTLSPGRLLNI